MKKFYSIITFISLFSNILYANTTISDKNNIKVLNIINYQRMLSQQITKAYLYTQNKIAVEDANKEIKESLKEFKNSYKQVNRLTNNKQIKRAINSMAKKSKQFNSLSKRPLNSKNIHSILNLSESILNQSEEIISLLKRDIHHKDSEFISLLGQQGMLAQRIAKYYIAYQTDKNPSAKEQVQKSIRLFNKNHKKLMSYKKSSLSINKKLKEIDRLWKITYGFYANIEKRGDIPLIVFETTDSLTNKMNELIKIYTLQIK